MSETERTAIASLEYEERRLTVFRADSRISRYPAIALRAICACRKCGSWRTAHRSFCLTDLPERVAILDVRFDDTHVEVIWKHDGHVGRYSAAMLRSTCTNPGERERERWWPGLRNCRTGIPSFDYTAASREENARLDLLEAIRDYGFAVLKRTAVDPGMAEAIAGLVGALRHPTTGAIHGVRYAPDPEYFAHSRHELAPHSDEACLHMPPSITCFHFVKAAAQGGETTLTDALRIGTELKACHPEAFALFCRVPVFSLDSEGDRAIGPLDAAEEDIEPFCEAPGLLLGMLHDRKNRILLPVANGEVLFFNNHRVMDGRLAFDPHATCARAPSNSTNSTQVFVSWPVVSAARAPTWSFPVTRCPHQCPRRLPEYPP